MSSSYTSGSGAGPAGPAGPQGDPGEAGAAGAPGVGGTPEALFTQPSNGSGMAMAGLPVSGPVEAFFRLVNNSASVIDYTIDFTGITDWESVRVYGYNGGAAAGSTSTPYVGTLWPNSTGWLVLKYDPRPWAGRIVMIAEMYGPNLATPAESVMQLTGSSTGDTHAMTDAAINGGVAASVGQNTEAIFYVRGVDP